MASKKSRRSKVACPNCTKRLKKSWTTCPQCSRPVMLRDRAGKAAAAFIAKSARPRCSRCAKASPAGSAFCVHCGTTLLAVVKSAAETQREFLLAKVHGESNPEYREAWWEMLRKATYGDAS